MRGTTTTTCSVHKEIQGGISRTHKIRKVTMLIQISQINLPWKEHMLGQAKINENLIMNLASNNKILENINPDL